jgi:hypothetical protein
MIRLMSTFNLSLLETVLFTIAIPLHPSAVMPNVFSVIVQFSISTIEL